MKHLILAIGIIVPNLVFAHGKEDHSKKQTEKMEMQEEMNQMHQEIDRSGQMEQMKRLHIETINKN